MIIEANDRILFTGDSITDCDRDRAVAHHLGFGYVQFAAARLQALLASPELHIFNRGISGHRIRELLGRVDSDLLALQPTVVSILIGINDTGRRRESGETTSAQEFERDYRALLTTVRSNLETRIVLLEPFLLPVAEDRQARREDLNPKIDVVRRLAIEFGTELLPLDGMFAQQAAAAPPAFWAGDGVHPTAAGHALIADAWLENCGLG